MSRSDIYEMALVVLATLDSSDQIFADAFGCGTAVGEG